MRRAFRNKFEGKGKLLTVEADVHIHIWSELNAVAALSATYLEEPKKNILEETSGGKPLAIPESTMQVIEVTRAK